MLKGNANAFYWLLPLLPILGIPVKTLFQSEVDMTEVKKICKK